MRRLTELSRRLPVICGRARSARGHPAGLVLVLVTAAVGCSTTGAGFGNPPTSDLVNGPALVSADGRVITAVGPVACGHAPKLVARFRPGTVTLTFVNPDTNCDAEMIGAASASTRLARPLGVRLLLQSTGQAIPSFSLADAAHVAALPAGFRLGSDLPVGDAQEPGDLRTYLTAGASGARLTLLQSVASSPARPHQQNSRPGRVRVHGYTAVVHVAYVGGIAVSRSVSWAEHGYQFTASIRAPGGQPVPLSTGQLLAFATAIRLSASQYR